MLLFGAIFAYEEIRVHSMDIFRKCYDYKLADEVQAVGLYPYFRPVQEIRGSRIVIEGKELIMIGSNNYLGLSHDPRVKEASQEAIRKFGTSCSGSRFLNGTLNLHEELEDKLSRFTGREAAIVYSTGYLSNLGGISSLIGRHDHVFTDKFNHGSIFDGIFMANGIHKEAVRAHRYIHNNMKSLEKHLKGVPADAAKLIVTDGVFSMEGDIVNLVKMKELADTYGARIYLDEAHAIGVIGATGRGTEEYFGKGKLADIIMSTFSKSFGSLGGFLSGEKQVINYIKHNSRPLIFSASMPPGALAAVLMSLEIIENEPEHCIRLQQIADKMIRAFKGLGFDVGTAETPIIPLVTGDFEKTLRFWKLLFEGGVYTNPVLPPAVPPDRCLIRTSYMSILSDDDLDRVIEICEKTGRSLGII